MINQTLASDADEARAFSHATEHIDIYSNSWGPLGWGNVVRGPGHLSQLALRRGTEKVTCYVYSLSGNISQETATSNEAVLCLLTLRKCSKKEFIFIGLFSLDFFGLDKLN